MKRRFDFDLTRLLCMCGVVYLHAASPSFYDLDHPRLWEMSNWLNLFAVLAVPLFFMMSGALLLSQDATADPLTVLRRRVPKVLVPLVTWSAAALLYTWHKQGIDAAKEGLRYVLNTPANAAYWFLYALIPMYLLSPVLKVMVDGMSRKQWRYLLLLWLGLTMGLYSLRAFLPSGLQGVFTEHWTMNINAVGGYLGYFLLGAYLDRLEELPPRKLLIWGTAVCTVLTGIAVHVDSYAQGTWSDRFTNYLTIFTALRAAGMFLLIRSLFGGKETKSPVVTALSGASFCVYLAHPLAVMVGNRVWFDTTGFYNPVTIRQQLTFYLLVLAACVLLALALGSIPVVCYLFTGQKRPLWRSFQRKQS